MSAPPDLEHLIRSRLHLEPAPDLPDIHLYTAHPGSGLGALLEAAGSELSPYWAYLWAGGAALAHHIFQHPELVRGKRVLDFGAGGGVVAIAAAKAGAAEALAAERDPLGRVALALNAAANSVDITILAGDLTANEPPAVDLVLAGDVFYLPEVAAEVLPSLGRCVAAGIPVLVGDPGRTPLPRNRLTAVAEYPVADMGLGTLARVTGTVYALR